MTPLPEFDSIAAKDAFVRRLARALIGDPHRADDVAQTLWLTQLERPSSLPRHPRAWWTTAVRRAWGKSLRGERRRISRERDASDPERTDPLTAVVEREEARRLLFDALAELEPRSRACLLLRYFDGLPPREIARRLDLPVETVKTRMKRGMASLRARLDGRFDGDTRSWAAILGPLAGADATLSLKSATLYLGAAIVSTPSKIVLTALVLGVGWWLLAAREAPPVLNPASADESVEAPAVAPEPRDERPVAEERAEAPPVVDVPSATPPLNPTRGRLVVSVIDGAGDPLPDVAVGAQPLSEAGRRRRIEFVRTDSTGVAHLHDLHPGATSLFSLHGGQKWVDVLAGEQAEVELVLEDTVSVDGVVVDDRGTPVPDATLWILSWRSDWLGNLPIARSDARGRFTLRHVERDRALGATASMHGPSPLLHLREVLEGQPSVLTLTAAGGDVRGRVITGDGEPVAGARVAIGEPRDADRRTDGSLVFQWSSRSATTDGDGRFSLAGVAPGSQPLYAFAEGLASAATRIDVAAGETTFAEISLSPGVTVTGVVRDGDGQPVAGAVILALDGPFKDPFPTQGPTDRGRPFHRPATRSGEDGAYRLDHVPGGAVHLYAGKGLSFWDRFGADYLGSTQQTLEGVDGERLEWDPVLTLGLRIHGRVTFADGTPMPRVFIQAKADGSDKPLWTHTDETGTFEIPELEARAYEVSVQMADLPKGARPLRREGVWPSEAELLLAADFAPDVNPRATLRARIVDSANRLKGSGTIVFADEDGWRTGFEEDGVWTAKVRAGRYQARVVSGNEVVGEGAWLDVVAGQDADLGDIHTTPACSLIVDVHRGAATADKTVWVSVEVEHHPKAGARRVDPGVDEVVFDDQLEGEVEVSLGGPGVLHQRLVVTLHSGENRVALTAEPAATCQIRIDCAPTRREGFGDLTVTLRRPDGTVYLETMWAERWGGKIPAEMNASLPIGTMIAEAKTTSGMSARQTITVESLDDALQVELRLE